MRLISKYKFEILIFLAISLIYFALRLPNLTLQPIFADEAIYIRWAQIMRSEPTLRFVSLQDGKTPFFMWSMIPFLKLFSDPLYAGRVLSILSGYLTLLGAFFLCFLFFEKKDSFNKKVALLVAFLIAITPMSVFFDRLALVDSMLAAVSIWALLLSLLVMKYQRIDLAMVLGYFLGLGMLVKTPGFFNILVVPTTVLTFNFVKTKRVQRMLKVVALYTLAIGIAVVIYNILRLGPGFSNLSSRNQDYIFSPLRLLESPLDPFLPHLNDVISWGIKFVTVPISLLVVAGLIFAFVKRQRLILNIGLWAIVPLLIQMFLLKTFTARYVLFSIPPLLCVAAWFLVEILSKLSKKQNLTFLVVLLILSVQPFNFSYLLLKDPALAPLPINERRGYLQEWTAGYGFKELAAFFETESKEGLVVIGTEGFFGTLPDGLWIYLDKTPNVAVIGSSTVISDQLRQSALKYPTYFVANKSRFPVALKNMELLREYPKAKEEGRDQDAILLFRINPDLASKSGALKNE